MVVFEKFQGKVCRGGSPTMTTELNPPKPEKLIAFLDLFEDVFYEVFRFLRADDLYFSVRNVCTKLRYFVDSYVNLGGVFMLVGGGCRFGEVSERRHSSEILYIFKQNGKVVSLCSKTAPALPQPLSSYVIDELQIHTCMEISFFGAVINGRIIAGHYCKEHWQEKVTRVPRSLWTKLRSRHRSERTGYRLVPYLYEFDTIKSDWLPILPSDLQPVIYQNDIDCDLSFCATEDSILVGLHINKGGEYGLGEDFDYKIACFRFDVIKQHDCKSSDISSLNYIK